MMHYIYAVRIKRFPSVALWTRAKSVYGDTTYAQFIQHEVRAINLGYPDAATYVEGERLGYPDYAQYDLSTSLGFTKWGCSPPLTYAEFVDAQRKGCVDKKMYRTITRLGYPDLATYQAIYVRDGWDIPWSDYQRLQSGGWPSIAEWRLAKRWGYDVKPHDEFIRAIEVRQRFRLSSTPKPPVMAEAERATVLAGCTGGEWAWTKRCCWENAILNSQLGLRAECGCCSRPRA